MDWLHRFIDFCIRRNYNIEDCHNPDYDDFWTTAWNLYLPVLLCSTAALTAYILKSSSLDNVDWEDITLDDAEEECSEARGDGDLLVMEPPLELYTNVLNDDNDTTIK